MPLVTEDGKPLKSNRRPLLLFLGGVLCVPLILLAISVPYPVSYRFGEHGVSFGTHYMGDYMHNDTVDGLNGPPPGIAVGASVLRNSNYVEVTRLSIAYAPENWYVIAWW